ncbi:ATP phosphoribosyltransferase [Tuberibacillus sp. Marseille-P3662]|uniref:ATP phosphoribosyltransferase n=1 Tax=Tuberibacillus sp. Marseille-P3662 TaxID=1965358 RepID=UPI000A1CDC67|nr:ATP phosphoribosyltransferase [Tuberibacillus sp. Marseille-P3662]
MLPLTLAMPKGRIFTEATAILSKAGVDVPDQFEDSRKLILKTADESLTFIMAKPMDVPTYVEYGVADIGIAGKDVMLEEQRDVYELLDLMVSSCHLAVAGLNAEEPVFAPKIATKYPNVAADYFRQQGEQVEIIKLNGSIELAPLVGLADRIVDIVSSGQTLKENGLVETAKIMDITSRLIVNPGSYRIKKDRIDPLIEQIAAALKGD